MGNVCSLCEKQKTKLQLVKLNKEEREIYKEEREIYKEEREIYKELKDKMKINRNSSFISKRKEINK